MSQNVTVTTSSRRYMFLTFHAVYSANIFELPQSQFNKVHNYIYNITKRKES